MIWCIPSDTFASPNFLAYGKKKPVFYIWVVTKKPALRSSPYECSDNESVEDSQSGLVNILKSTMFEDPYGDNSQDHQHQVDQNIQ